MYSFDENVVSDLYKDAYGFRPRGAFWADWDAADDDGKQRIWDYLITALKNEMERERELVLENQRELESRIAQLQECGAQSREDAIRWLAQSEGCEDRQDGYAAYCFGIDYKIGEMYFGGAA
jgi:hypothetical protein